MTGKFSCSVDLYVCVDYYDSLESRLPSGIKRLTRWFFALSARVDLPLDADTAAAIRSAMKGVARARTLTISERDTSIAHLNLALAIGGDYFKQWKSGAAIAE